jgi:hypothetical protein
LAAVLDAGGLSTAQMQSIATEFNYSETTFVLTLQDAAHLDPFHHVRRQFGRLFPATSAWRCTAAASCGPLRIRKIGRNADRSGEKLA